MSRSSRAQGAHQPIVDARLSIVLAVIDLSFDPFLQLGQLAIRWQTVGATVALLAAFALAAREVERRGLHLDHMLLILVGIVPGAVVGGRIVHVLCYADAYLAAPLTMADPRVGGLSLLGAVIGGTCGALYVISRLGAPARQWAAIAAVPLLLALGLGKNAQLLGGSGQGLLFDGSWAVAFLPPGPWIGASPEIPSHPSQVYEGVWLLIGAVALVVAGFARGAVDRVGGLFVGALLWFFAGRVLVGFTWRDPLLIGPLNTEQLLALLAIAGTLLLVARGIVETTESQPRPRPREPKP
jgi:prolipoprotein diacylglyceryltransferase